MNSTRTYDLAEIAVSRIELKSLNPKSALLKYGKICTMADPREEGLIFYTDPDLLDEFNDIFGKQTSIPSSINNYHDAIKKEISYLKNRGEGI